MRPKAMNHCSPRRVTEILLLGVLFSIGLSVGGCDLIGSDENASSPEIAYTSSNDGRSDIYRTTVGAPSGRKRVNVTRTAGLSEFNPAWSPDGSRIAYTRVGPGNNYDVYVTELDGNPGGTAVTDTSAYDGQPSWSPDGSRIAFRSDRDTEGDGRALYTVDPDGTDLRQVTAKAVKFCPDCSPDWSPDGSRIAFTADDSESGDRVIFTIDPDGTDLQPVRKGHSPSWSPDGSRIAFTWMNHIYTVNSDGSDRTQVTDRGYNNRNPDWSSSGDLIVFQAPEDPDPQNSDRPNIDIYIITPEGTNLRRVTDGTVFDEDPTWRP